MKPQLKKLIEAKREWHYQPTPAAAARGFTGWRSRGYLPHFDAPGVVQFITYRLHDAMPAARRREWEALFKIEDERQRRTELEAYLDVGHGECHLRDPRVASLVQENLLHHDGKSYQLLAWVIMPNHVHVLVDVGQTPLAQLLHGWKSYTATQANRLLGRRGQFWQDEYFDRAIRDTEHLQKAVRYIENNPNKAHLCGAPAEWPWGSAALRADVAIGARAELPARSSPPTVSGAELTRRINEAQPATVLEKLHSATQEHVRAGRAARAPIKI